MTDTDPPPPDDLNELASAILDGEATDDDRRQAAANPALGRRIEEFESLADQVRAVPTLDDETRTSLLAGAAAALEPDPPRTEEETTATSVVSLERHRNRPVTRLHPFAVAAVIVAVLAIPAVLIGLNRDSGVYDSAASSGDAASHLDSTAAAGSGPSSDAEESAAEPDESAVGSSAMPPPAPVELGAVFSSSELETAVGNEIDSARHTAEDDSSTTSAFGLTTTLPSGAALRAGCENTIRTQIAGLGPLVLSGTVTYQGVAREVYAFEATGPGKAPITVVAVEPDTCIVVVHTTMPSR